VFVMLLAVKKLYELECDEPRFQFPELPEQTRNSAQREGYSLGFLFFGHAMTGLMQGLAA